MESEVADETQTGRFGRGSVLKELTGKFEEDKNRMEKELSQFKRLIEERKQEVKAFQEANPMLAKWNEVGRRTPDVGMIVLQ